MNWKLAFWSPRLQAAGIGCTSADAAIGWVGHLFQAPFAQHSYVNKRGPVGAWHDDAVSVCKQARQVTRNPLHMWPLPKEWASKCGNRRRLGVISEETTTMATKGQKGFATFSNFTASLTNVFVGWLPRQFAPRVKLR